MWNCLAPVIVQIVNEVLRTGILPCDSKLAIILPLLKKHGLDRDVFRNFKRVSNLSFISKVIEKVVSKSAFQPHEQ